MVGRILKIILGLLLLPFCAGFTWQLAATSVSIGYKPDIPYYFIAGGFLYLTMHILFRKPILTYVFGHELTHAFFALLFGGAVKAFHASERGGQVTITKSNFIITLAPYFFPLYTFLSLIGYWLAILTGARYVPETLIFLAGATFAFHLVLTFHFLSLDQKDIQEHGAMFSYPLIYLFNIGFAALLVYLLLSADMRFLDFLVGGIMKSMNMIMMSFQKIYDIMRGLLL